MKRSAVMEATGLGSSLRRSSGSISVTHLSRRRQNKVEPFGFGWPLCKGVLPFIKKDTLGGRARYLSIQIQRIVHKRLNNVHKRLARQGLGLSR